MTTAKKYLLIVLAVEGVLLFAAIVVALVLIARSYNGQCGGLIIIPGFGSDTHPCSFVEHMKHYSGMTVFVVFLIALEFWFVAVPIVLLAVFAPVIAYMIGRRRSVMAGN